MVLVGHRWPLEPGKAGTVAKDAIVISAPIRPVHQPKMEIPTWFKNARFWVTLGIRTWNVVRLDL